jgi:prophage DNA circulation protein
MNAVDTLQKRLHDEIAAVEKEIQSHNQQVTALNQRLEGLKRAVELFKSEQSAIVELLRTSTPLGEGLFGDAPIASAAKAQNARAHRNATPLQIQSARVTQKVRAKTNTVAAHPAARKAVRNGGLKRIDMIAAVLKRHRELSVRELIAALDREFSWKSSESSVTAHLYTNQNRFVHTKPDRAAKRPVTWSLK